MREMLCSKIHKATVTEADLSYTGSITIDEELLEKADLWERQKVLVASITTGNRLETYTMKGPRGSGVICMNGAAAHIIKKGEEIIIMGFEWMDKAESAPRCILVDENNCFISYIEDT